MASTLRFEQGLCTHVGAVRKVNEDAYVARPRDGLWAVADGMGGHRNGQWASAAIARALEEAELPDALDPAATALADAIKFANGVIVEAGRREATRIGSTVAALLVRDGRYVVLWAGDSRVYRCRADAIDLLTTDHSPVEQMVRSGLLDPSEARNHPMAHVLSRAVGVGEPLLLDRVEGEVAAGDVFLLCSDGLTRLVGPNEICRLLGDAPPHSAAATLVQWVLDRGAPDNVTVAVVGCDATTLVGQ